LAGVIEHPYLQRLYFSYNKLKRFTFESPEYLRELETLELRKNRLTTFGSPELQLSALKNLFLAQNCIDTFPQLKSTSNLEFLDLRRNKLRAVVGNWPISSLKYLNLSFNYIEDVGQIETLALRLPQLAILVAKNNPLMADENAQNSVVMAFKNLTRFNAVSITKQMRLDIAAEFLKENDQRGS
jgi:protein phosphatase 1 regulatory subunit 7